MPAADAAPITVVSVLAGRSTVRPRMSACICISRSFVVIPPSTFSAFGSPPIAHTTSRACKQVASSAARAICRLSTNRVNPTITPRASGRHRGANSPENAGTITTPPLSSTWLANVSDSAAVLNMPSWSRSH